jgi:hypothetical protein
VLPVVLLMLCKGFNKQNASSLRSSPAVQNLEQNNKNKITIVSIDTNQSLLESDGIVDHDHSW